MSGVSYILTVYNKAPYLPGVIAGLAAQRGDFAREFIFVDDGSTDGSPDLIESLTAGWGNVQLLRRANGGPGAATNAAAEAAKYDFLKIVDGDDILVPQSGAWLLQALQATPGAAMAYGTGVEYQVGAPIVWPTADDALPPYRVVEDPLSMLIRNSFICPSFMMMPRALYSRAGGCAVNSITQDYSLQIKVAAFGRFVELAAPVALTPAVAPGRLSAQVPRVLHDVNLTLLDILRDNPALTPAQRRLAIKRATGRALRYRRRHATGTPLWQSWLRYLQARLPLPVNETALIAGGLKDFGVPSQIDGFRLYRGYS